ncbi:unnamed protein product [Hymenolepis diminuta]|uniref:Ectonucleoside triphosphate diphosphohydrolase 1 n=1 Tax=Hymenolepis diminuta TaxID=6216 RepID=A0A0R3SE44_HYMDI|nr:unnamed protein product [Hymenolepis diminuta]
MGPGISSYKNDPKEAYNKLEPNITNLVKACIPSDQQSRTHQYLAATAGMRLLDLENPLKSEAIIEVLQLNLPRTGLKLGNPYSDVRVMSGRDEGIYAFITVNYLLGKFGDQQSSPVDQLQTVGSLDLGGASTQIAFVSEDVNAPHTSTRGLFGNDYTIYSYSYLCYGKSAAEKRVWAQIIVNNSNAADPHKPIENPCLNMDKNITIETAPIFDDQCVTGTYASDLVGSALTKPMGLPSDITFYGTGDPDKCREFVRMMFPSKTCSQTPCMFGDIYRPALRGNFLAFSGFTYSAKFFGVYNKSTTRTDYRAQVDKFCKLPYADVKKLPGYDKYTYIYCFDGAYIETLLAGYGFEESESWKKITFEDKVNNAIVSWAMGYTIDATGMIESASPQIKLDTNAFIASVVCLSIIFVILLGLLLYIILRK